MFCIILNKLKPTIFHKLIHGNNLIFAHIQGSLVADIYSARWRYYFVEKYTSGISYFITTEISSNVLNLVYFVNSFKTLFS